MIPVLNDLSNCTAGIVVARGVTVTETKDELKASLENLVKERSQAEFPPQGVKDAVRDMLRSKTFKPTGRNKPASEYLAQAAREGRFPFINNLVDINNYVSLASGLPISLLDLENFKNGLRLRLGYPAEKYIFNTGGQEIELEGLICACSIDPDIPLGNAIKDSMKGKIKAGTVDVAGVIYCPKDQGKGATLSLAETVKLFAELLSRHGDAQAVETVIK